MKMKTNERSPSVDWWNDLTWKEQLSLVGKYLSEARMPSSVTASEIEKLYQITVRN